jgi:hypothetical protein
MASEGGGGGGLANSFSEILVQRTGIEVALIDLREYIAVRYLTGWTGWILDIFISNFEKPKHPLETSNLYNEFLFLCEIIIRIFVFDTHRTLFAVCLR